MPNKRGRPKGITASKDTLAVVCLLKELKWSNRRIGRLFHRHHTVISDWYSEASKTIGDNFSAILVNSGREVKMMRPSGNSTDIEYIFGKVHQGSCGGGRGVKPHNYDDEYEDEAQKRG